MSALGNLLPDPSRIRRVATNLNLKRMGTLSSGRQAFDVATKSDHGLATTGQPGNWRASGLVTSAKRGQHSKTTSPADFRKRISP